MAWIDRLIDYASDVTESVKAWAIIGGVIGMGTVLAFTNPPLAIAALLLTATVSAGPTLDAMEQEKKPTQVNKSPSQIAEEDDAVTAFVQEMEAAERFQAMVASEVRPARNRLH